MRESPLTLRAPDSHLLAHKSGPALAGFKRFAVEFLYYSIKEARRMPLLLAFVLIGIWRYPDQIGAWATVSVGKWSSWSLLVIMTFAIVANLKHVMSRIHVPG